MNKIKSFIKSNLANEIRKTKKELAEWQEKQKFTKAWTEQEIINNYNIYTLKNKLEGLYQQADNIFFNKQQNYI